MWNYCRLSTWCVYSIQPCTSLQCHFITSHIHWVHVCFGITCHLHFWQNDQGIFYRLLQQRSGGTDTETRPASVPVWAVEGDGVDSDVAIQVHAGHLPQHQGGAGVRLAVRQEVNCLQVLVLKRQLSREWQRSRNTVYYSVATFGYCTALGLLTARSELTQSHNIIRWCFAFFLFFVFLGVSLVVGILFVCLFVVFCLLLLLYFFFISLFWWKGVGQWAGWGGGLLIGFFCCCSRLLFFSCFPTTGQWHLYNVLTLFNITSTHADTGIPQYKYIWIWLIQALLGSRCMFQWAGSVLKIRPLPLTCRASSVHVLPLATKLEVQRTASWQFSSVGSWMLSRHFLHEPENWMMLNLGKITLHHHHQAPADPTMSSHYRCLHVNAMRASSWLLKSQWHCWTWETPHSSVTIIQLLLLALLANRDVYGHAMKVHQWHNRL